MKTKPTFQTVTRENFDNCSRSTWPPANHAFPSFDRSRSLEMALAEVPEVRASEVARGKALIADPNYPSQAQVKQIARILAVSGRVC